MLNTCKNGCRDIGRLEEEDDFRICTSVNQNEVFCYHSVEEYFLLSTTTILLYHLSSFRSVCKNDNNNKMLHLIDPYFYQEEYTTVRYPILEFIPVQCYTTFREQNWLALIKCCLITILQKQNMHRKALLFFIEKYYNTAASNVASYACATQVPSETLIVV